MVMVYHSEKMQSKISKGKVYGLKAWLTLVQAFKSPFPVESPTTVFTELEQIALNLMEIQKTQDG